MQKADSTPRVLSHPWPLAPGAPPVVLFFGPHTEAHLLAFAKASGLALKKSDIVRRGAHPLHATTVLARAAEPPCYLMHVNMFWRRYGGNIFNHLFIPDLLSTIGRAAVGVVALGDEPKHVLALLRIARHVGLKRVIGWTETAADASSLRDALSSIESTWRDAEVVLAPTAVRARAADDSHRRVLDAIDLRVPATEPSPRVYVPMKVTGHGIRAGDMKATCHFDGIPSVGAQLDALSRSGVVRFEVADVEAGAFRFSLPNARVEDVVGFCSPGAARAVTSARLQFVEPPKRTDGILLAFGHSFGACRVDGDVVTLAPDAFRKHATFVAATGAPVLIGHDDASTDRPASATLAYFA